jgi:hypothetical protein
MRDHLGREMTQDRVARQLVDLAAALSPSAVRDRRREQWHADLIGSRQAGMSPASVALGAVSTAALHRSSPRPSGVLMPTSLSRPAQTTALLVAGAVLSIIVGFVLQRTVFYVWTSPLEYRVGEVVVFALVFAAPLALFLAALLRAKASTSRRVLATVTATVSALALSGGQLTGGHLGYLAAGVSAGGLVAAWMVTRRPRSAAWLLTALPMVAIIALGIGEVALGALVNAPPSLRPGLEDTARLALVITPLLAAVAAGAAAARRPVMPPVAPAA